MPREWLRFPWVLVNVPDMEPISGFAIKGAEVAAAEVGFSTVASGELAVGVETLGFEMASTAEAGLATLAELGGWDLYEMVRTIEEGLFSIPEVAEDHGQALALPKMGAGSLQGSMGLNPGSEVTREVSNSVGTTDGLWNDLYQHPLSPVSYEHHWSPESFSGVGDPLGLAQFCRVQNGPSCAINAQLGVIESLTGHRIGEADAARFAEQQGWYNPESGTPREYMAELLTHHGIETDVHPHGSIQELAQALEQGDHVIVAVNAEEIWSPLRDLDSGEVIPQPDGGHAVWITGFDPHPDGTFSVIMNDSGLPGGVGQMRAVSLEDFMEAWKDFDNHMIVAHRP